MIARGLMIGSAFFALGAAPASAVPADFKAKAEDYAHMNGAEPGKQDFEGRVISFSYRAMNDGFIAYFFVGE